MQKIINGIAIFSGVVALGVVGVGGYVYIQKDAIIEDIKEKDAIIEDIKEKAINAALGGVGDSLPDMMDTQLPPVTGAPVPLPSMP